MKEKFLTVAEVAKELRLSCPTITRYLRSGALKGLKFERVWRMKEEDLAKFLAERGNV